MAGRVSSSRRRAGRGSPNCESFHLISKTKTRVFDNQGLLVFGFLPLTLRLGLLDVIAPDVDAMSAHKHRVRVRVLLHGLLQILGQVLLVRRVLDDGDAQGVVVAQVARLLVSLAEALDLLNVVNLKDLGVAAGLGALLLEEQGDEDGPLGVRVDAAAGAAAREGGEEERRALAGLEGGRGAQVGPVLQGGLLGSEGENVDVGVLHEFLLDARRGNIDKVTKYMKSISMMWLNLYMRWSGEG